MVTIGDCFLVPNTGPGDKSHLFVVVSSPTNEKPARIFFVPVCTYKEDTEEEQYRHDKACILEVDEHEFLIHRSYIDYRHIRCESINSVIKHLDSTYFEKQACMDSDVLKDIIEGVNRSRRIPKYLLTDWNNPELWD